MPLCCDRTGRSRKRCGATTGTDNHRITTGSCASVADVLSVATSEAISRAFESYVSRIINSDQIDSDLNEIDVAG